MVRLVKEAEIRLQEESSTGRRASHLVGSALARSRQAGETDPSPPRSGSTRRTEAVDERYFSAVGHDSPGEAVQTRAQQSEDEQDDISPAHFSGGATEKFERLRPGRRDFSAVQSKSRGDRASCRPDTVRDTIHPSALGPLPSTCATRVAHWNPGALHLQTADRVERWARIGASRVVQSWLRDGVRVNWAAGKAPEQGWHDRSIPVKQCDKDWLRGELKRQIGTGAIEPAECDQFISNAFVHTQPNGKRRLVINLAQLNDLTDKVTVKFETLRVLRNLAQPGDWSISFDLQDGFHCIQIDPEYRKYFTFEIDGQLWQYAVIPFGWTNSPYVFVKTMRPVVNFFRSHVAHENVGRKVYYHSTRGRHLSPGNLRCLPYMDDFLFLFRTEGEASLGATFLDSILTDLGLTRSIKKSVWTPTQRIDHLGLTIDLKRGCFLVPKPAVEAIQKQARTLLKIAAGSSGRVPVRMLAKFTGKVASVDLAVPLARFRTRSLHEVLGAPHDWECWQRLSRAARTDLKWWEHLDENAQERAIWLPETQIRLHCDASGEVGWGAAVELTVPAQGFWRAHQMKHHITLKELKAVRFAVESFLPELAGKIVQLYEDNQAVVATLMKGSTRSPLMMKELRKLFDLLGLHGITLRPQYIRSHLNVMADRLSRERDANDWKLNPAVFEMAAERWGLPTVDRFATANNAQCKRFNSRYADPQSEARDAFAQLWKGEHSWCNPPWGLIGRVLRKIQQEGASATLVLPYWTSQYWWPLLTSLADEVVYLQPARDLFLPGDRGSRRAVGRPNWSAVLVRIYERESTSPSQQCKSS